MRFYTVHDLIPILFPQFFDFGENHFLREALDALRPEDWVIAVSRSTKQDLCNHMGIDPERVIVTHEAADPKLFHPHTPPEGIREIRTRYQIPEVPYLLCVSTLEPRKNLDGAIRAFAQLVQQERISDLNLAVVGTKGWDFDRIFSAASDHGGIRDRIIFPGYVADEDLAGLYSGALAFIYPSLYEGFGLPPLEAMQCGVPVITSNTSSLPEVVGDAGIMVDPRDLDALSQAMLDVHSSAALRETLAARAVERAAQFSWRRCVGETIEAYRLALQSIAVG